MHLQDIRREFIADHLIELLILTILQMYVSSSTHLEEVHMTQNPVSFVGRIFAILSELLVLFLIWRKTFRIFGETTKLNFKANLPILLLRDGKR